MSLKAIRGQDGPVKIIRNFFEKGRFPQSLLILGPAGSGKKFTSIQIAKALLCKEGELDSCEKCESCLKIDKSLHPDLKIISKNDSNFIKIEQIRLLKQEIGLKPYESEKKVFLLHDIQDMNEEAANAFLKTLEEPQNNAFLILTSRIDRFIFPTLLSRCQKIKFNLLSRDVIENILIDNQIPESQAKVISRLGDGDISWILAHRDNLIGLRDVLIKAINSSSRNVFISAIGKDRASINEDKLKIYLKVALSIFRDALLIKNGTTNLINADIFAQIVNLSQAHSKNEFIEIIDKIDNLSRFSEQNLNIKLVWDLFFSQLNTFSLKKEFQYV